MTSSGTSRTYAYVDEEEDLPSESTLGSCPQQSSTDKQAAIAPTSPLPGPTISADTNQQSGSNIQRAETPPLDGFVFDGGQWHNEPVFHEQGADKSRENGTKERVVHPPLLTRNLPPSMGGNRSHPPFPDQPNYKGGRIEQMIGRDRVIKRSVIGSVSWGQYFMLNFLVNILC